MSQFLKNVPAVSFFGRPYEELLGCFGLSESELAGKSVLECPSGPSSFVARALESGVDAIGVDPLFYRSPEAIRILAKSDFTSVFADVRRSPERFARKTYSSIEEAERRRREGLDTFLKDYARNYATGRYRVGALPNLEFDDAIFDLVLCAHLLFIYSEQFDFGFHGRAIEELCRVAKREVRIHPIVDLSGQRYARLEELRDLAGDQGFASRIREVDHEFFRGANETLILERVDAAGGLGRARRIFDD